MTSLRTAALSGGLARLAAAFGQAPLKPFGISTNSLAFRLFATSALWTLLVLPLTAGVLSSLYRQELERDFDTKLEINLRLIVATSIGESGTAPHTPDGLSDEFANLYTLPQSGYYWQIRPLDDLDGRSLVSPSLLDGELVFPAATAYQPPGKKLLFGRGPGPRGEELRFIEQIVTFGKGPTAKSYAYVVTARLEELEVSVSGFRNRIVTVLALLGVGLAATTFYQVRYGLKPLSAIELGLAQIRSGKASRLEGELPEEIKPLQGELNALIRSNEEIIERARTHVGNLAHALKTPLSVIANEAEGQGTPFARKVAEQAAIMRTQVAHHLDRARMVARTATMGGVTEVKPAAEALVRTLAKIHGRDRGVELTLHCPPDARFSGEKQDLEEMLGNLLENACKWADRQVELRIATLTPAERSLRGVLEILVEDDGPGIGEEERKAAIKRGRRLDETKPGSGLGLSIVSDLVGLYGGTFALERAELGGLRARLTLPAA